MSRTAAALVAAAVCVGGTSCTDSTGPTPGAALRAVNPDAGARWTVVFAPIARGVHTAVLPGLDGPNYSVAGINDWAEVVGTHGLQSFHYQLTRGITTLATPAGWTSTHAAGVNNSGHVAVSLQGFSAFAVAVWSWDGSLRVLPPLSAFEGFDCFAGGIDDKDEAVGYCYPGGPPIFVPTRWSRSGRPDVFGGPHGIGPEGAVVQGTVTGASGGGWIAGGMFSNMPAGPGFLISPGGQATALPTGGSAYAVNDSGWAAGATFRFGVQPPCYSALAWLRGLVVHNLGICGYATGITDDGVVVGTATDSAGHNLYAFVWTDTGGVRRLPGLDAIGTDEISNAVAINRAHQIVGSIKSGGAQHVVMWTLP